MNKPNSFVRIVTLLLLLSGSLFFSACTTVDVFEKNAAIPGHAWAADFKPEISFTIEDSAALYNIYIVLRHADAYRFKNIWVNVHTLAPNGQEKNQPLELQLATDEKGWLGSGMDDIFEHRIQIAASEPLIPGKYVFTIENIMREDPLNHIMNVGIRLEKAK